MRALWIEIVSAIVLLLMAKSRPVRALWIEILKSDFLGCKFIVEAREGLVD